MAGKINVFNLGALGVDLVTSPIHMPDGAWRLLQNAEFSTEESEGGVKKRGSLTKLNTDAAAGSILSAVNVPLPLSTVSYLVVALLDDDSGTPPTWKRSLDGATFTDLFAADLPFYRQTWEATGTSDAYQLQSRTINFQRAFYYPGDNYVRYNDTDYTNPPFMGSTTKDVAYELLRVPPNPTDPTGAAVAIYDMLVTNGLIFFATEDSGGSGANLKGRVLAFNPANGVLTEIGNRFGDGTGENTAGFPNCLALYQGSLYAGTYGRVGNNQGKVYRIQPGVEDTWTLDKTLTLHNGYVQTMCAYQGVLYVGSDADSGGTAVVLARTASGSWSTSKTAPTAGVGQFKGLIVFDDTLFVAWKKGTELLIYSFDGSTWTEDLDVATDYSFSGNPGDPIVFKGDLYWPFASGDSGGMVLKRTTAGVWSQPLSDEVITGVLGIVTPDV